MNTQHGVVQTVALVAFAFGLATSSNFWTWHPSVANNPQRSDTPVPRNFGIVNCVKSGIIVSVKLEVGPLLRLRSPHYHLMTVRILCPSRGCIKFTDADHATAVCLEILIGL